MVKQQKKVGRPAFIFIHLEFFRSGSQEGCACCLPVVFLILCHLFILEDYKLYLLASLAARLSVCFCQ